MRQFIILVLMVLTAAGGYAQAEEELSALELANSYRRVAGLAPVGLSVELSSGCRDHARYLVLNHGSKKTAGLLAHKEFLGMKGYTEEGRNAAQNSDIYEGADSNVTPAYAIAGMMATFYHRVPLLNPALVDIGVGYAVEGDQRATVVDCISNVKRDIDGSSVTCYPAASQAEVPLRMEEELPNPAPDENGNSVPRGFPATITFGKDMHVTGVSFSMTDNTGKPVECLVSDPEHPATSFSQWNTICAVPVAPLVAGRTYRVRLHCHVNGKPFARAYAFSTVH